MRGGKNILLLVILMLSINVSWANIVVPFEVWRGLIIVEAEINGEFGNYIIDSGANTILLNDRKGSGNALFETLDGQMSAEETKISSFRIGDYKQVELIGFKTDLSSLEIVIDKELNGIVGCSVFTPNKLIFDFEEMNLVISAEEVDHKMLAGKDFLSYEVWDDVPVARYSMNGFTYNFIIDTGASSHFVSKQLLDSGLVFEETGIVRKIITATGEGEESKEYEFAQLRPNGKFAIKAFAKDFSSISEALGKEIHGLLSLSKLATGKVCFDVIGKRLYF